MTTLSRILDVLSEGPSTASEIALELGVDMQRTTASLSYLLGTRRLMREQFHLAETSPRGGRRRVWLYSVLD